MSKQDRQGARTPAQLEQKYNFDKSFSEIMGVANDSRKTAEQTQKNLKELFLKDLKMTGTFTNTAQVFLEPGAEEINTIQRHIIGSVTIPDELIPFYDFNDDGEVNVIDLAAAAMAMRGIKSLYREESLWKHKNESVSAELTINMSNPDKIITISATNIWGNKVERYIGINYMNIPTEADDVVIMRGTEGVWTYEKWLSGKAVCWCNTGNKVVEISKPWHGVAYYGNASFNFPAGLFCKRPDFVNVNIISGGGLLSTSINTLTNESVSWYVADHQSESVTRTLQFTIEATGSWQSA